MHRRIRWSVRLLEGNYLICAFYRRRMLVLLSWRVLGLFLTFVGVDLAEFFDQLLLEIVVLERA